MIKRLLIERLICYCYSRSPLHQLIPRYLFEGLILFFNLVSYSRSDVVRAAAEYYP